MPVCLPSRPGTGFSILVAGAEPPPFWLSFRHEMSVVLSSCCPLKFFSETSHLGPGSIEEFIGVEATGLFPFHLV